MTKSTLTFRDATPGDAERIATIYNHFIVNTVITFEETTIDAAEIEQRIHENQSNRLPWLVALQDDVVVGYAYANRWKGRCAYRFSVEITVYVDPEMPRRGIGSFLYKQLFTQLKAAGFHSVIAGISLPNDASVALHERVGLVKAGPFKEVGVKFNQRVDVAYWQGFLADLVVDD